VTHVALDLSLSNTGVAYLGGSDVLTYPLRGKGTMRLRWWASALHTLISEHRGRGLVVVSESPFMHREHPKGSIGTIKLHGVAELVAGNLGARYVEIDNQKLKKYATGKGNASKDDMLAEARSRGCVTDSDDEADAFLLWWYWQDGEINRGRSAPVVSDTLTGGRR
jgi:crossover junction endodeoxyribonuclease RuvC